VNWWNNACDSALFTLHFSYAKDLPKDNRGG
jgi:hypothetical protein